MADDALITPGVLVRKGSATVPGGSGSVSVTFDQAFPNGCDGVFVTNTNNAVFGWVSAKSVSGFTLQASAGTNSNFDYVAIGH